MVVGGALLYGAVGILCMLMGGAFLDYSVLADNPVLGQQLGILVIEFGVGMAVCGALLSFKFEAFLLPKTTFLEYSGSVATGRPNRDQVSLTMSLSGDCNG